MYTFCSLNLSRRLTITSSSSEYISETMSAIVMRSFGFFVVDILNVCVRMERELIFLSIWKHFCWIHNHSDSYIQYVAVCDA